MTTRSRPLVMAHRGASADHPENTLEAFRGASEQSADWVELDVHLSADGELVVHHDPLYPDGRSVLATHSAERPSTVPLLWDAIAACAGMGINIEVKNVPQCATAEADAVVELLERGPDRAVLISSFDEATLDRVRQLAPHLGRAQLTLDLNADPDAIDRAIAAGAVAVHPWDPFVDEALLRRCHDSGTRVNAWTVNDPARMVELAQLGADGIITDVPAIALSALGAAGFS